MNILAHEYEGKGPIIINWDSITFCKPATFYPACIIGNDTYELLVDESLDEIVELLNRSGSNVRGWDEHKGRTAAQPPKVSNG